MKQAATVSLPRRVTRGLAAAEEPILAAFARYFYLTAEQLRRLRYGNGSLRYAQDRLKSLTEAGYLLAVERPPSQHGKTARIFTLHTPGRNHVLQRGYVAIPPRYRPSEETTKSYRHWDHVVAAVDCLIAFELVTRAGPQIRLVRLLNERELKTRRWTTRVEVPARHATTGAVGIVADTVQPDGFAELHVRRGGELHQECYYVEADNGSEFQAAFREKIRALVAFARGPYRQTFGSEPIVIAVIATPGAHRAELLRVWTEAELTALGAQADAALFAFVGADPATMLPTTLLLSPIWRMPFHSEPFALIADLEVGAG